MTEQRYRQVAKDQGDYRPEPLSEGEKEGILKALEGAGFTRVPEENLTEEQRRRIEIARNPLYRG